MLPFCRWVQDTSLSAAIAQSTWGVPIIGALHVLAIALFGGAAIFSNVRGLRRLRQIGLLALLITGALLFWSQPVRCCRSVAFGVKMGLLLLIACNAALRPSRPASRWTSLALWAGVILASRGIAFF
jgi:hypothetical protein